MKLVRLIIMTILLAGCVATLGTPEIDTANKDPKCVRECTRDYSLCVGRAMSHFCGNALKICTNTCTTVSSGTATGWEVVGSSIDAGYTEVVTNYADPSTILKTGDRVKMWTLADYKTARGNGSEPLYLSTKNQREFDCKTRQQRFLLASFYGGNMGRGVVVATLSEPGYWQGSAPDNLGAVLLKFACDR